MRLRDRIATCAALLVTACAREAASPVALAPPSSEPREAIEIAHAAPLAALAATRTASPAPEPVPMVTPNADDALVASIFAHGGAALRQVLGAPEMYRFQLVYGIVKDGAKPALERHGYRADAEYFYPASSMKVPIALAAYDWATTRPGLGRDAMIKIHPLSGADPIVTTLARETWRALIVSDNSSANRLLGLVGHREVHETLWGLGIKSARVRAGFSPADEVDPAEQSPKIEIGADAIAPRKSTLALPPNDAAKLEIGKAFIDGGRRIDKPMSFADKNAIRIVELQDALVRIMRPELLPSAAKRDAMSKEDLGYLRQTLGTLPSESGLAGFDRNIVADYQLIPFLRGVERVRARGKFEIHSKVGQAFGFLIGNAYIVDKETGKSFFLVAAIYANHDETLNDDEYDYDTVAFPALADVAEVFCRHAFGSP